MHSRPTGITIVAIVLAFSGVLQVLTGTESLGITKFGLAAATDAAGIHGWAAVASGVVTVIAAGGLFTLAGWAWLLVVVVLGIRVVADVLAALTQGPSSTIGIAAITNLVISGVLLWYFLRPNVKSAFGR
jgi:hypothetical protein